MRIPACLQSAVYDKERLIKDMDFLLDRNQDQAVHTDSNAVVAAGAGSGKTRVLSIRFLRLIKEGKAKVNEILTLTFTRKAAAEMHERIYKLLLGEKDNPLVLKALQEFDTGTITTLDGFCSRIIRSGGRKYGIPAGFSVDEQAVKALAEKESYLFILEHSENEAMAKLIAAHGLEKIWKQLFASLAVNEFDLTNPADYPAQLDSQFEECRTRITDNLEKLLYSMDRIAGLDPQGKDMETGVETARAFLAENRDAVESRSGDFGFLADVLSGLSLKKTRASKGDAELYKAIRNEAEDLQTLILNSAVFLNSSGLYVSLYSLIGDFQDRYLKAKRNAGVMGFSDLLKAASYILSKETGLRAYYKKLYRYIMIDEFQDNNHWQKDLLFLLAEEENSLVEGIPGTDRLSRNKLFFVGDEKQSIYLFRGADVRVFKGLGREIRDAGGKLLSLEKNYRSHTGLIEFFNGLFPEVMGEGAEPYEAGFSPLASGSDSAGSSSVAVYYLPDTDETSNLEYLGPIETEAFEVGKFILEACQGRGCRISRGGEERTPDFSDFALLMRSSSSQIHYEKIFRRMGIPYSADNVRSLFLEAPANDIYGLLQLALVPSDTFAYAVYLRSPFVCLGDDIVLSLLNTEGEPFSGDAAAAGLSGKDAEKYETGRQILLDVRERIDVWPIGKCIEYIWYELGYRFTLLRDTEYHGYLEFIDYLSQIAKGYDKRGESMSLFLEFLSSNLGKYKRLDEIDVLKDSGNSVQLMSIHRSKGLEFPIVIIGAAGQVTADTSGARPYYMSETHGLSVHLIKDGGGNRINPFYDEDRELRMKYEEAELKRLLYVACTRAEQHLLIAGSHNKMNRNKDANILNMILSGIGARENPSEHPLVRELAPVKKSDYYAGFSGAVKPDAVEMLKGLAAAGEQAIRPVRRSFPASGLNAMYLDTGFAHEDESCEMLPPLESDPVLKSLGKESQFGILVHLMCEHTLQGRYSRDNIPQTLLGGFSDAQKRTVTADAEFLCSKIPGELFELRASARTEEAFTMKLPGDGIFVEGQFDYYAEKDDEVVLYDFKTDRIIRPGEYDVQLALYRNALAYMYGKPVRSYLVYLRNGAVVSVTNEINWDEILKLIGKLK